MGVARAHVTYASTHTHTNRVTASHTGLEWQEAGLGSTAEDIGPHAEAAFGDTQRTRTIGQPAQQRAYEGREQNELHLCPMRNRKRLGNFHMICPA